MSQKIYELFVFTTFSSDIKSKYKIALRERVLTASIHLTRRNRLVYRILILCKKATAYKSKNVG